MAAEKYDDTPRARSGVSLAKGPVALIGIASLALGDGDLLDMSKIGTLAASIGAGCVGSLLLMRSRTELRG